MTEASTLHPFQTSSPTCEVVERSLPRLTKVLVQTSVRLGHRKITVHDLCQLVPGTVLELSRPGNLAAELVADDLLLATGDVVRNGIRLGFRLHRIAIATSHAQR